MEQLLVFADFKDYDQAFTQEVRKEGESFIRIGFLLRVGLDTDIIAHSGYRDVWEYAEQKFHIEKSQASRYINVNKRFSRDGYSDTIADRYRGFGIAKLVIMLQLPDAVNEELTPGYSKAEIQAVKEEVEAEGKVSDIELMLEAAEAEALPVIDGLGRAVRQLGEDAPQLFAAVWGFLRQQDQPGEEFQSIHAPAGEKIYSVRPAGEGRKQLILKDDDNGGEAVLVDLRRAEKTRHTWEEVRRAWENLMAAGQADKAEEAWEAVYSRNWPREDNEAGKKEKPARKESKVQKAPAKEAPQKSPREAREKQEESPGNAKEENQAATGAGGSMVLPAGQQPGEGRGQATEAMPSALAENAGREGKLSEQDGGSEEPSEDDTDDQIPGQTSIEKDFPQYMPQMPPGEAAVRWNGYMSLTRGAAQDVVRYAEMRLYGAARQQLQELHTFLEEMEKLDGSPEEPDRESE